MNELSNLVEQNQLRGKLAMLNQKQEFIKEICILVETYDLHAIKAIQMIKKLV